MNRQTNSESNSSNLFAAVLGSLTVLAIAVISCYFLLWRDAPNNFKAKDISTNEQVQVSIPDSITVLKGDTVLVQSDGTYIDGFSSSDTVAINHGKHIVELEELE